MFSRVSKRVQSATKNKPAYGIKYPGLVTSFAHRISLYRILSARVNKPITPKVEKELWKIVDEIILGSGINTILGQRLSASSDGSILAANYYDLSGDIPTQIAEEKSIAIIKNIGQEDLSYQIILVDNSYNNTPSTDPNEDIKISGNGEVVLCGNSLKEVGGFEKAGEVLVFGISGEEYSLKQTIIDVSQNVDALFGSSLAISSDVSLIAISSPGKDLMGDVILEPEAGEVLIFGISGEDYALKQTIIDASFAFGEKFGRSIAMTPDKKTLVVQSNKRIPDISFNGKLFVYEYNDVSYSLIQEIQADTEFESGNASFRDVRLSDDGNTLVVSTTEDPTGALLYKKEDGQFKYKENLASKVKTNLDTYQVKDDNFTISPSGERIIFNVGAFSGEGELITSLELFLSVLEESDSTYKQTSKITIINSLEDFISGNYAFPILFTEADNKVFVPANKNRQQINVYEKNE